MSWKPKFDSSNYKVLNKKNLLRSFLSVSKFEFEINTFEGKNIIVERELLHRPKAVSVLLYKAKTDEVALVEQFRPGAINEETPWLLELVAGMIEENESIETTAKRETEEEAGCKIEHLIHIHDYLCSPGISDEKTIVFCGIIKECHSGIFGNEHEGEDIKLNVMSALEAFELVKKGKILNVAALLALQWLQLNHSVIKDKYA